MNIVYHGSKEKNLKNINPKKSTHGKYVYATTSKVLALHFSGRCGDDLTYGIGHFDTEDTWELVETIPHAFDEMYSNSASIYYLDGSSFKDIKTGFCEVVSDKKVDVLKEENIFNVFEELQQCAKEGLIKIYRYPNKPKNYKKNGLEILDKWEKYIKVFHKSFKKYDFDRLLFLHPMLLDKINDFCKKFNYPYRYKKDDLVVIFKDRIERQLLYKDFIEFIDSAYISICNTFPSLKIKIDPLYNVYLNNKNII